MTEFEDVISEALHEEANRIEISRRHAERIFDAALVQPSTTSRHERLVHRYGAARTLVGSALSVALVALVVVPLTAHESTSAQSALRPPGQYHTTFGGYDGARQTPLMGAIGSSHGVAGLKSTALGAAAGRPIFAASNSSSLLRIEQTGSLFLFVSGSKFVSTMDELRAFATAAGGVVSNSQTSISHRHHGEGSSGYLVLAVPATRFNLLINEVRGLGRATSLQTSATDVTGQYSDLSARIHAAQVSRTQYLAIMSQAHTIGAILAVQSQIDAIQSQIDRLQGQLNVINHETTFSTLTVDVSTPGSHVVTTHARTGFSKAWHDAIAGFLSGFQWVVRVAGPLAFVAILLSALVLLVRSARRVTWRQRS